MKEDQKNLIIFFVLAAVLLFAWSPVVNHFFPTPAKTVKVETTASKNAERGQPAPTADGAKPTLTVQQALVGGRVAIETPDLKGTINLKGARIDDLVLKRYAETVKTDSPPVRLLSPVGAPGAYFAEFGWLGSGVQAPTADTVWQASAPKLTPTTPVTLTATNATGQTFRIDLSVDEHYMFTIRQSVANAGKTPVSVTPYALVNRAEKSKDLDQWAANVGPITTSNGSAAYLNYSDVEKAPQEADSLGGWAGFTDHYWLTALVPDQGSKVHFSQRQGPSKAYQADTHLQDALRVAPGRQVTYTSRFFAGAKEVKVLNGYEKALGIKTFGLAIDWGWFSIVEQPIFYYLDWLFRLIGNFGVAIILLTITIRGLLFPIAHKQFESMAKMRILQPKMKALQERYKDDKAKQQQEIMKLYKEEKVNPLAGCVPILLQIPIMFALYKVLLLTIEMRHAPFALWIHDLSVPDPANLVNLIDYLFHIPLPGLFALGVFPLLLGVSMYFQMKLNPAPMDEIQKQVFAIMPWMLMFVMAPFAVGLQLYWITSNCITILQQRWLYSRHPHMKEPAAKAGVSK
ncbi:membrane protein insertase YidC [Sphingomonas sp.]|uniref:membrane protein insertase YidC n=1 Tax=Sphingomonas sp. TaxID=28214 RepID=UPI001B28ED78|nr:membrane protein insertase YidC [Sphingomonas sp.]MBO9711548.1 membrane protein insertase YidC [Sphingomonas sp.]